jgi:hypothetical protein
LTLSLSGGAETSLGGAGKNGRLRRAQRGHAVEQGAGMWETARCSACGRARRYFEGIGDACAGLEAQVFADLLAQLDGEPGEGWWTCDHCGNAGVETAWALL